MGVANGLKDLSDDYYHGIALAHERKRDLICSALESAGLTPFVPAGSSYVLADMARVPGVDSREKAMRFLRETGVACVPGRAFYHDDAGETLGRFCFAKEDHILGQACAMIASFRT
jgi:aminotransferase